MDAHMLTPNAEHPPPPETVDRPQRRPANFKAKCHYAVGKPNHTPEYGAMRAGSANHFREMN